MPLTAQSRIAEVQGRRGSVRIVRKGLAGGALALRRIDSTDLEGGARVAVTAFVTATQRVDTDVEKIVGRLSLEPNVSAATWQVDRSIPEA